MKQPIQETIKNLCSHSLQLLHGFHMNNNSKLSWHLSILPFQGKIFTSGYFFVDLLFDFSCSHCLVSFKKKVEPICILTVTLLCKVV